MSAPFIVATSTSVLIAGAAGLGLLVPAHAAPAPVPTASSSMGVPPRESRYSADDATFAFVKGVGQVTAINEADHVLEARYRVEGENGPESRMITVKPGGHFTFRTAQRYLSLVVVDPTYGFEDGVSMSVPQHAAAKPVALHSHAATVRGDGRIGHRLTAHTRPWGPSVRYSYQWLRNGKAIAHATHSTYVPSKADSYSHISVKITGARHGHAPVSRTSAGIFVGPAAA